MQYQVPTAVWLWPFREKIKIFLKNKEEKAGEETNKVPLIIT